MKNHEKTMKNHAIPISFPRGGRLAPLATGDSFEGLGTPWRVGPLGSQRRINGAKGGPMGAKKGAKKALWLPFGPLENQKKKKIVFGETLFVDQNKNWKIEWEPRKETIFIDGP